MSILFVLKGIMVILTDPSAITVVRIVPALKSLQFSRLEVEGESKAKRVGMTCQQSQGKELGQLLYPLGCTQGRWIIFIKPSYLRLLHLQLQ